MKVSKEAIRQSLSGKSTVYTKKQKIMKKQMDSYTACSIVEGFSGETHTLEEELEAWAYLIKTGQCWTLQGWYGRNAMALIESGYISKEGKILKNEK